jgi:hypothetical protein
MSFTNYEERYGDLSMDPGEVLRAFVVSGKSWKADELWEHTLYMEAELASAYIGLFKDADFPTGTTRLLHAPRRFAAKLGKPSKFDYDCFAFLDDVMGNSIQAVEYDETFFECTEKMLIHTSGEAALTMWEENPDLDLLSTPIAGKQAIRVPKMMYVPAKYIKQPSTPVSSHVGVDRE